MSEPTQQSGDENNGAPGDDEEMQTLENAWDAASRRWTAIVADPRVAIGYFTDRVWVRSSKPPKGLDEHSRLGLFHRDRLWVRIKELDSLKPWLAERGAIALVDMETVKEVETLRDYRANDRCSCPELIGSKSIQRYVYGDMHSNSAASLAARAGWVLFDFSLSKGFDIFTVLNDRKMRGLVEPSPLSTFSAGNFDFAPWDFGAFGTPREVGPNFKEFPSKSGGKGVTIVVNDTGLIAGSDADGYARALSDDVLGSPSDYEDPYANGTDIALGAGHGVFVAGIIKNRAQNANIVVSKIWCSSRLLIDETEIRSDLVSAIGEYPGKLVLNWSFSSHSGSVELASFGNYVATVLDATGDRIILVCAAGNDGLVDPAIRPSGILHPQIVSVGATERPVAGMTLKAANWSNYGQLLAKVWSVGVNVVAPFISGTTYWTGSGTTHSEQFVGVAPRARWSGTSFAAPIVAAAAAVAFAAVNTATEAIDKLYKNTAPITMSNGQVEERPFVDPTT
jgi:hypothetical protein